MRLLLICAFGFLLSTVDAALYVRPHCEKDFFVITIPKSGSNLIKKLLHMLVDKDHAQYNLLPLDSTTFDGDDPASTTTEAGFENRMQEIYSKNQFFIAHFNHSVPFARFWKVHSEFVPMIMLRDLRDVLVSCVYFQARAIEKVIGPSTFDQKLTYLLSLGPDHRHKHIFNIYRNVIEVLNWIDRDGVVVCRFEEIVGEKGGGSRQEQDEAVCRIANSLEIKLSDYLLNEIADHLFGVSAGPQVSLTFRSGQIGEWKEHFKPVHIELFKKKFGYLQEALGYSNDFD